MATPRKTKAGKTAQSRASRAKTRRKAAPPEQKTKRSKAAAKKKAKAKVKTQAKKPTTTGRRGAATQKKPKPPSPARAKPAARKAKLRKPAVDPEMQKQLREALVSQRERLLSLVQSTQAQMAEKTGDLADVSDRASEGYGDELAVGLMAIEAAQLDEIEEAIRRIDNGTYGLCIDCGKPIPRKRLEVLPFAQRCLACKGKKERGVPTLVNYGEEGDS